MPWMIHGPTTMSTSPPTVIPSTSYQGYDSGSAQKYVTKKVPAKAVVQSTTVIVKVAMPQGMSASS